MTHAALTPEGKRRECPACGGMLNMVCNSDETIWFAQCEYCSYSELPKSVREQAFAKLQELQKHPHTTRTIK